MMNENNIIFEEYIIDQSLASNIGIAALAGLSMLGPLNVDAKQRFQTKTVARQDSSKIQKLTPEQEFIAKVLYSQTSTLCTREEVIAIAKIIQNRIGKRDFGNCNSAIEVCKHPGTFTSVKKHNRNWDEFFPTLNKWTQLDVLLAKILTDPTMKIGGEDWMKDIVYYHDKSIPKPKSWDNKYYRAVLVKETKKFKFYKIEPRKSTPMKVAKKQPSAKNTKG